MRYRIRMSIATGAAAAGLAASCCPALAASATTPPAWQAENLAAPVPASLSAGVAVNAKGAWAVGSYQDVGETTVEYALIEHWNGDAWSGASTKGIASGIETDGVAVSGSQVWVSGEPSTLGTTSANPYPVYRLSGSAWVSEPTPSGIPHPVVVSGPDNQVWAIGDSLSTIARWTGTAWDQYRTGLSAGSPDSAGISSLSFNGSKDGWAVGGNGTQPVVMHWNGSAWSKVAAPALPKGAASGGLQSILVTPSAGVWATGYYGDDPWLVRWNGKSWATVALPKSLGADSIGNITESAKGLPQWISVSNSDASMYLYYSGTAWTLVRGVTISGQESYSADLMSVPGSNATWAFGSAYGEVTGGDPPFSFALDTATVQYTP
jgi:hypothetical protein